MPAIIPKEALMAYRRWEVVDFDAEKKAAEASERLTVENAEDAPPPENAALDADENAALSAGTPEEAKEAEDAPPGAPFPGDAPPETPTEVTSEEIPAALPTAADIERVYAEAHQQGHAAGHDEGYQEGFRKGFEEGIAPAKAVSAQMDALFGQFEAALAELDQKIADQLLAVSLKVAEQVLMQSLRVKPELLLPVVGKAVDALHSQRDALTLFVHPDDAKMLRENSEELPESREWRVVENTSIAPGGCRVEVGAAELDATLQTRWRRVVESIGITEEWFDGKPWLDDAP
jgi:flagellar assembly protein FliH